MRKLVGARRVGDILALKNYRLFPLWQPFTTILFPSEKAGTFKVLSHVKVHDEMTSGQHLQPQTYRKKSRNGFSGAFEIKNPTECLQLCSFTLSPLLGINLFCYIVFFLSFFHSLCYFPWEQGS